MDPVTAYSSPVGMFNRYKYAANNPYRFTDPDGRRERPDKVTGSNIPGSSTAKAMLAKTAITPQTLKSDMVSHVGPKVEQGEREKQTEKLVGDGNKAGSTMQRAGDSRALNAFNRIASLRLDSSDWSVSTFEGTTFPDSSTVAYVDYAPGRITFNSARYFDSRKALGHRIGLFIHETLHLDAEYDSARIKYYKSNAAGGWAPGFERDVEKHKGEIMKEFIP